MKRIKNLTTTKYNHRENQKKKKKKRKERALPETAMVISLSRLKDTRNINQGIKRKFSFTQNSQLLTH